MGIVRDKRTSNSVSIFMGIAVLLFALALVVPMPIDVRYALILIGATSGFCGGFIVALDSDQPVEAGLAGELAAQGASTTGSLVHALGGRGNAVFLPPDGAHDRVTQWIPAPAVGVTAAVESGSIVVYRKGSRGILLAPLAGSLLARLKSEYGLVIPAESGPLTCAIREVCEDVLPVARRVDTRWDGDRFIVTLHRPLLFSGCASVRKVSPEQCILCPCSVCSLVACMVAEGLGREVVLDRVDLDAATRLLRVEVSCLPETRSLAPA